MSAPSKSEFRKGNKAIDSLVAKYQPMDPKIFTLGKMLPRLSKELYAQAKELEKHVSAACGPSNPVSGAEALLAHCIFDLMLTVYFQELCEYLKDNDDASILVDALLYETLGCETGAPTPLQVQIEGTHHVRGIQKYVLARQLYPKTAAGRSPLRVFGKEVAALQGAPLDYVNATAAMPYGFLALGSAQLTIKHFLYGVKPTEADWKALNEKVSRQTTELRNLIPDAAPPQRRGLWSKLRDFLK